MSKQEVMDDARAYANMAQKTIYVYRRGDKYKATSLVDVPGWKLAEIVLPDTHKEASLLAVNQ